MQTSAHGHKPPNVAILMWRHGGVLPRIKTGCLGLMAGPNLKLGGSLEPLSLCHAVFRDLSTKAQAPVDPRSVRMPRPVLVWPPADPDAITPGCQRKIDGVAVAGFPLRSYIIGFTRGRHMGCNDDYLT